MWSHFHFHLNIYEMFSFKKSCLRVVREKLSEKLPYLQFRSIYIHLKVWFRELVECLVFFETHFSQLLLQRFSSFGPRMNKLLRIRNTQQLKERLFLLPKHGRKTRDGPTVWKTAWRIEKKLMPDEVHLAEMLHRHICLFEKRMFTAVTRAYH